MRGLSLCMLIGLLLLPLASNAGSVAKPGTIQTRDGSIAYAVGADQTIWGQGVDLEALSCLTLKLNIGNHIYGTDYSDNPSVLEILRKYFPQKEISSDSTSCPYVFHFVIFVADTHAIKYEGSFSRMMMS